MQLDLNIRGGGDTKEMAAALRQIAAEIERGEHEDIMTGQDGFVQWMEGGLVIELTEPIL